MDVDPVIETRDALKTQRVIGTTGARDNCQELQAVRIARLKISHEKLSGRLQNSGASDEIAKKLRQFPG
jgi:hypothetical protein